MCINKDKLKRIKKERSKYIIVVSITIRSYLLDRDTNISFKLLFKKITCLFNERNADCLWGQMQQINTEPYVVSYFYRTLIANLFYYYFFNEK